MSQPIGKGATARSNEYDELTGAKTEIEVQFALMDEAAKRIRSAGGPLSASRLVHQQSSRKIMIQ